MSPLSKSLKVYVTIFYVTPGYNKKKGGDIKKKPTAAQDPMNIVAQFPPYTSTSIALIVRYFEYENIRKYTNMFLF